MLNTPTLKSVFEYDNYRDFLRDVYLSSKQNDAKFSYRYFSRIAGFQSPNFLKLVIDGQRNLASESIEKIAKALKLKKDEALFFHHLVLLNQATSSEEKKIHTEQLLRSKVFKKIYPLKESEYNYYAQWYFVPIRELVSFEGFQEDPEWIAKQLNPAITAVEAKKALVELEKLGLIRRDASGRLQQTDRNVETPNEVISPLIRLYHKEMLNKAGDSIDRFPREKRDISAVTITVTEGGIKKIKELIQQLRKEIIEMSSQEAGAAQVYQLGFQFFPLTEEIKKKTGESA
ncbi:MAG: TIGR02147 family protein [Bdellovibrionales bacterium]